MFLLTLETKETAFLYALASATVVHAIAEECREQGLPYCKCDSTLHNGALGDSEKWGCSADIDFSVRFTKQLLHGRLDNVHDTASNYKDFVLHNSKIGQWVSSHYVCCMTI